MKVSIILIMFLMIFGCNKNTPQEPAPDIPYTDTVTDIDGNVYKTVKIGDQVWMAENLKVTRYRNGNAIPNVTTDWSNLTTGALCALNPSFGLLYNWYAVADSRNIAPEGWHVPTDEEWQQLEMYLGMSQSQAYSTSDRGTDEGGKLKESGTAHWQDPNTGATNVNGFTALPGGYLNIVTGYIRGLGNLGYWWSASAYDAAGAWSRFLLYDDAQVGRGSGNKRYGFSVRCVRD